MMLITALVGIITFLVFLFLVYIKWKQKYWARKNVPYIKPTSLFGTGENPFNAKKGLAVVMKEYYDELKRRGHKHGGGYVMKEPMYVPVDIDLVKCILAKDFQHFLGRGLLHCNQEVDPLSAHLFNLEGEKLKNMRVKLTPTFTSGKMKMMFQTLLNCGSPMLEHITELSKNSENLDIKEVLACYTTDIIGSCAFGIECNSFKDPNADFRKCGRRLLMPQFKDIAKNIIILLAPWVQNYLRIKLIPLEVESFFLNTVRNVLDYRRKNNIQRNDFIHLFIEMQDKAKADKVKGITVEEITAQSVLFFIGGFETSSTTMTFCLHELAFNQDIQDKLREEVRETLKKNNGVLTYDSVMGMKYMDQVVNETLRKYPPLPFLNRQCTSDYKVPGTDVVIEKGIKVFISTLGIHRDEEFYPDPDKFNPERFTEQNREKRPHFSFIPFGEGPRICIAVRFGMMQTKTGLSMLLNSFKFTPAESETYNIAFEPVSFILSKKGPTMLNAESLPDRI